MPPLDKALITNTTTGESFPVMYNPEEFKLDQGNSFAEIGIPGLGSPPLQYVRGRARTLTMDLLFDTYAAYGTGITGAGAGAGAGAAQDVRRRTAPIVRLLDKDPLTHAPPVLLFSLGGFRFECVLVDAGQRYSMFLPDGTPVRCTLSVRLQEYVRVDIDVRSGLFIGSPTVSAALDTAAARARSVLQGAATVHIAVQGDTLSSLAADYLGDPGRWREIARANDTEDPFALPPGLPLIIPTAGGRRP
ncbi:LysM peptidoglycan-binding domain-containing protein [Streptomyces sp. NBC_01275]|uniref:CIS tube protein n=1 Tax=Streptomyces sp. NBC_01275 TaxID=2903807 RepID=UPI00224F3A69|nr:LysM peptidoglycan-binding domain-containing protein [Streptomyces sp. NBC_01275]MCX4759753.1 LysM peptidoglycan-binding domain-containing protein [Streptomyces sp. NBC_01275]